MKHETGLKDHHNIYNSRISSELMKPVIQSKARVLSSLAAEFHRLDTDQNSQTKQLKKVLIRLRIARGSPISLKKYPYKNKSSRQE